MTKLLALGGEEPPADADVVIRGGEQGLVTVGVPDRIDNTGAMSEWQLWVDFHRIDGDGFTHAHVDDLAPGVMARVGQHLLVGDEGADPAVAEVAEVQPDGVILLRVLPGHADAHRSLLVDQPA